MQLRDPALLISIIGLPVKKLTQALNHQVDTYRVATSNEGLLDIRKYWDLHCSTLTKLPAIALLDTASYPKGLSDSDFLQLLSRITDLLEWQIWDLWDTLDIHNCGYIGCSEFTLVIILMCAGLSQQQMAAVHTFRSSICRVFAGAHVFSPVAGIMQCCQLMNLPTSCLIAAVRHFNIRLQHFPTSSSGSSSAACGSMGKRSPYKDAKAAVKNQLHAQGASSSTTWSAAGPDGNISSSGSSTRNSSTHMSAGPKAVNSSSNKVLPEVAGNCQDQAEPSASALEGSASVRSTTALDQGVQLLLYVTTRLAQGDLAVLHEGCEASRSPDLHGIGYAATSSKSTTGSCQSRCLCCVIS